MLTVQEFYAYTTRLSAISSDDVIVKGQALDASLAALTLCSTLAMRAYNIYEEDREILRLGIAANVIQ